MVTIPRDQIDEMTPTHVSTMPKGLLMTLTRTEILDLLFFLESAGDGDNAIVAPVDAKQLSGGDGQTYRLNVDYEPIEAAFVSMGNPHAVIYVDDVSEIDLECIGPSI